VIKKDFVIWQLHYCHKITSFAQWNILK